MHIPKKVMQKPTFFTNVTLTYSNSCFDGPLIEICDRIAYALPKGIPCGHGNLLRWISTSITIGIYLMETVEKRARFKKQMKRRNLAAQSIQFPEEEGFELCITGVNFRAFSNHTQMNHYRSRNSQPWTIFTYKRHCDFNKLWTFAWTICI